MYNGVINVYKEKGYTSFDVVARLRGIFHQKKIGHTGTLDPDAEGVLVVCLGSATKLCDILTDKDKSYEATLLLGKTSDTEDASGKILSECEVLVTEDEVKNAMLSFVGTYDQIPPMYSAIKVNGKKLYELARLGQEIERTPRPVQIHEIEIISIDLPRVVFRVSCGKGTYIRSLCRDIGEKLGCGGLMEHLVRNSVNSTETGKTFLLEHALKLEQIEQLVKKEQIIQSILAIDSMFPNLSRVQVVGEGIKKLANGNLLTKKDMKMFVPIGNLQESTFIGLKSCDAKTDITDLQRDGCQCLVYDTDGVFTAIYQYHENLHAWKVDKMFLQN
ncbi:MAG: tRNA pseudouridine(55) synthase TruB [Eubacteriales bacterium]|nr:tRNA pseudouridine(55) synthase TruB [Eubacteriales bacterium]